MSSLYRAKKNVFIEIKNSIAIVIHVFGHFFPYCIIHCFHQLGLCLHILMPVICETLYLFWMFISQQDSISGHMQLLSMKCATLLFNRTDRPKTVSYFIDNDSILDPPCTHNLFFSLWLQSSILFLVLS